MEPAGMSGTVTISDQRSYIKIDTLRGKNPTEIHGALGEVCGVFTVERITIYHRINPFRGGCVSIDKDPRPGRPRTPTDEKCVKLVADALEEDRRTTCEQLSRARGEKTFVGKCTRTGLSCSWLGHPFSMTMLGRTLRIL